LAHKVQKKISEFHTLRIFIAVSGLTYGTNLISLVGFKASPIIHHFEQIKKNDPGSGSI